MEDLDECHAGVQHEIDGDLDAEELEEDCSRDAGWEEETQELQVDGDFYEGDYEGCEDLGYVSVLWEVRNELKRTREARTKRIGDRSDI